MPTNKTGIADINQPAGPQAGGPQLGDQASRYNLEPPLVALILGLIISNVIGLPRWLDAGFRVELYIKLGIGRPGGDRQFGAELPKVRSFPK